MSVLTWIKEKILGKNGYVAEKQDAEIQEIKKESQEHLDKTQDHLQNIREEWTKLHRKTKPREEPV